MSKFRPGNQLFTTRWGTFAAVLVAFLVVIAFIYPVGFNLNVPTGVPEDSLIAPECYSLTYPRRASDYPPLPRRVQLTSESFPSGATRSIFVAQTDEPSVWWRTWWAYAGSDSVDIGGHHTPILRVPRTKRSGSGRVIPYVDGSLLLNFLFPPRESVVEALRVSCDRS